MPGVLNDSTMICPLGAPATLGLRCQADVNGFHQPGRDASSRRKDNAGTIASLGCSRRPTAHHLLLQLYNDIDFCFDWQVVQQLVGRCVACS